ncbi:MAG: carboxyltransferase domain-containing protein [Fimbriimonadaceae bacterium]|nr:carboxyltransferase domain-containing protein [Fimbriimonadaceae bacterium]QYK55678.1 MAG: carboxyltransferase domain-containing protein [Fimbriimonadaceae bacterium]
MLVEILDGRPAHLVARALRTMEVEGLLDVNSSYDALGLYYSDTIIAEELEGLLDGLVVPEEGTTKDLTVPCCYELGPDLAEAAGELGLSESDFVALHSGSAYTCYAIGFQPGFPYLGWLPERLCGLGRLPSPRAAVLPGAVGVTGRQTGIYPGRSPGGWRLIGRTPLVVCDPAEGYFPIEAGDTVVFRPIRPDEFHDLEGQRL